MRNTFKGESANRMGPGNINYSADSSEYARPINPDQSDHFIERNLLILKPFAPFKKFDHKLIIRVVLIASNKVYPEGHRHVIGSRYDLSLPLIEPTIIAGLKLQLLLESPHA